MPTREKRGCMDESDVVADAEDSYQDWSEEDEPENDRAEIIPQVSFIVASSCCEDHWCTVLPRHLSTSALAT